MITGFFRLKKYFGTNKMSHCVVQLDVRRNNIVINIQQCDLVQAVRVSLTY